MNYFLKYSYYMLAGVLFAVVLSALIGEMKWELIPIITINAFIIRLLDDCFDYKKDKTYYLHGNPRHFSEEELNLNFWFFDEPINVNNSPEDDEILFYRHDIFELNDLLSYTFINNLNFYWNLKEEFPISCIKVCDIDERQYEKVVYKLIDLIKNTTDYNKKDVFIRSLSPFYSKISNKQLIIEAIKVTVKTFKDEKINEEQIINWLEFIKIQHPYLNTYKLFKNPDEYVQIV